MPVSMRHMIYSDSTTIHDSKMKPIFKGDGDVQGLSSRAYKVNGESYAYWTVHHLDI